MTDKYVDATYVTKNYSTQGGSVWVVSGVLDIPTGGIITTNGTQAGPTVALTDSSGGTPGTTIAAIAAGSSYAQADAIATKNALASLAAQYNAILVLLQGVGITT